MITDILGWKTYYRSFFIENSSINVEFFNNRTEEITAGACLLLKLRVIVNRYTKELC